MKKLSLISVVAVFVLIGSFAGYHIVLAATGGGTATIADTTGTPGVEGASAGVTAERGTSDVFTVALTIDSSGMTLGASSPTFTIPDGFTMPATHAVATAGEVDADGEWSVTMITGGVCVVSSDPSSSITVASGRVITVDITASCADGDKIVLTYKGISAITMGATALTVKTANAGDVSPVTALDAGSPTITVTDTSVPTVVVTMSDTALTVGETAIVTFTFSEDPTGFDATDVNLTNANGTIGTINTDDPLIQTAVFTPTNGITDAANVITVGTDWTDVALNDGVGGSSPSYTIDTIASSSGSNPQNGMITVIKTVVNNNGGTKVVADFPLFVNGVLVVSGVTHSFPAPASAYTVTETSNVNYTQAFSGACDSSGQITLSPGDMKICVITNDDIGASLSLVPPLIDVVKVPSPLALPNGAGPVTYTYTLRNIGTVPVANITMVGDTCSPIVLASGDTNGNAKLEVSETWVYKCSTTLSSTHTNTVTTTGWANGISAVDIASATVVVGAPVIPPLIHVTKVPSPLALSSKGGTITYTEKITNPGTVALSNVQLTDDKCSPMKYISGDTNNDSKLGISETWVYTCQATLDKTTTNTATASGDANGLTAKDYAIVTVLVAAPGLPNTGFAPEWGSMPLGIALLVFLIIIVYYFYFGRRK